jgi:hypothetical protein
VAATALTIVAGAVAAVVLAPAIDDAKQDDAAAERRLADERRAERVARLRAELRPQTRRAPRFAVAPAATADDDVLRRRRALVRELERAVLDDARARVESGELRIPVRTARCERFPRRAAGPPPEDEPATRTGRYECLALTSRIVSGEDHAGGAIGYPFRARIDFATGDYAFCKISGRAGEGAMRGRPLVAVPRICGGG